MTGFYTYPEHTPIILFTRAGSELESGHYGAILSRGWPGNEQLHYIPLDYDSRPECQVRKVVSLLEKDEVITDGSPISPLTY